MGHPGRDIIKRLPSIATGIKVDSSAPLQTYEACIITKHPRKPYLPSNEPRAEHMLDLIHSDLCGPFPTMTPHGKLHFVVFHDDHTNLLNIQLLATKDQALDAWHVIKTCWENHSERQVKRFPSDNGWEFISAAFMQSLEVTGIERQLSALYSHQQNGKAEHCIRAVEGCLFTLLETASLPATLWGEAALTVCYLWNRSESCILPKGVTPYKMVNSHQPDLSHLRVFGAKCFACIPTELQVKLGPHSCHAIFIGYLDGTKGYRLRDKDTGTFFTTRDIIFDENMPSLSHVCDSDDDDDIVEHTAHHAPPLPAPAPIQPAPSLPIIPDTPRRSGCKLVPTTQGQLFADKIAASKAGILAICEARADKAERNAPLEGVLDPLSEGVTAEPSTEDLEEIEPNVDMPEVFVNLMIEEHAHITIRSDRKCDPSISSYDMKIPPATYIKAVQRPDCNQWLSAMKSELKIM